MNQSTPEKAHIGLKQQAAKISIGALALALPLAPVGIWGLSQTRVLGGQICFQTSLSHNYYIPFSGDLFVGVLFFIGFFMIWLLQSNIDQSMQLDLNLPQRILRRYLKTLLVLGGVLVWIVALVPTAGPGCDATGAFDFRQFAPDGSGGLPPGAETDLWLTLGLARDPLGLIGIPVSLHQLAAGLFFAIMILIVGFVFTQPLQPESLDAKNAMTDSKARRNRYYFGCAGIMTAGLILLILNAILGLSGKYAIWDAWNATYWLEAVIIWAFGFAWLVKGRMRRAWWDIDQSRDNS